MTKHLPTDTGPAAVHHVAPADPSLVALHREVEIATTVANVSPPVLLSPCAFKRRSRSNLHPKTMCARIATAHWSNRDSVSVAAAATTFATTCFTLIA
jgi:hypothetical protein